MIEMSVHGISLDPVSQVPIVVLKSKDGEETILPIWIGAYEANGIAMRLQGVEPPRPMTYELIKNILTEMGAYVESIYINDLKDNTYYAQVHITQGNNRLVVDSRPSDAINLALRFDAPIYVSEEVLEKSKVPESEEDAEKKELREWLENIKPDDFEIGGETS